MKNFNTNADNNDDWLTPPKILSKLGEFDLDPCSPSKRPWPTAKLHYSKIDDGLSKRWVGRVWCNHCSSFKGCTRELSGDSARQHGSGLPEMQHEQTTSRSSCLAEKPTGTCPDCGLPAFPVVKKPRIYCNPPYGRETFKWLNKLAAHGNGIALIFARTETIGFHSEIWDKAHAIFFFKGRIKFYRVTGEEGGTANAPSCLVAYGLNNVAILKYSGLKGKFIILDKPAPF